MINSTGIGFKGVIASIGPAARLKKADKQLSETLDSQGIYAESVQDCEDTGKIKGTYFITGAHLYLLHPELLQNALEPQAKSYEISHKDMRNEHLDTEGTEFVDYDIDSIKNEVTSVNTPSLK